MPDKPEDYGEVLYRWKERISKHNSDFYEYAIVRVGRNGFKHCHKAPWHDRWLVGNASSTLCRLLSIIAAKDKALKEIAKLGGEYADSVLTYRGEEDEIAAKMTGIAEDAIQPKEQHGKA